MLKTQFPLVGIALFSILTVTLPATSQELQYAFAQTGFWTLQVDVNNIPNDVNTVIVTVKGAFGNTIPRAIDASTSNSVSTFFDIPTTEVPDGYNYNVCVRESGGALDLCRTINHNGGIVGRVTINWPDSSVPQSPGGGSSSGGSSGEVCSDTALMGKFNIVPIQQLCNGPIIQQPPLG